MGLARRLAGISKRELLDELGKGKIERHYTAEEFEEDLEFAKGGLWLFILIESGLVAE